MDDCDDGEGRIRIKEVTDYFKDYHSVCRSYSQDSHPPDQ
jgi:hypothetical protein